MSENNRRVIESELNSICTNSTKHNHVHHQYLRENVERGKLGLFMFVRVGSGHPRSQQKFGFGGRLEVTLEDRGAAYTRTHTRMMVDDSRSGEHIEHHGSGSVPDPSQLSTEPSPLEPCL